MTTTSRGIGAAVTHIEMQDAGYNATVVITLKRGQFSWTPEVTDLPDDFRTALKAWIESTSTGATA